MVKLNVFERLTMMGLLPQEGSFVTLRIQRELMTKLGMSEDELKEFDIKQEGVKVTWNEKGIEEREMKLGEKQMDMIKSALVKLDGDNKLEQKHFSLYEKFVEKGGKDGNND
jgi:hypothetical protein